MDRQRLIEKAKKLRRLAKDEGATQHEALAASRALAHLMQVHRLSEACLADAGDETMSEVELFEAKRMPSWRVALAQAVAEHWDCAVIRVKATGLQRQGRSSSRARLRLIGHRDDVFAGAAMFRWLSEDIQGLAPDVGSKPAFRLGFALGVADQLRAAKHQAVGEEQGGALVLLRREAVDAHLRDMPKSRVKPQVHEASLGAGRVAGRNHALNGRLARKGDTSESTRK